MSYGVVLFYTTSSVMRAEKILKEKGFNTSLIPTPRQFSSDCGISLRFDWDRSENIKEILESASVEFDSIKRLQK